ncbi:Xaa-Pro dipeptidyl-peptidase [Pseudolactococcus insecticola]|uniref:Xaa-Pro dipeptidyl-peptidase n=1 Tax=Pseudolactococcus insecticola TaxID=2709158 RepID=A0A6A0B5V0_9LACT|nr:Xaa-Pro dipeptidyl-peptidase [Lactococcus insecticola]GFH40612.1 Xaa-Pro dipeptidyl-peptidase [Lactococcus insecticola]
MTRFNQFSIIDKTFDEKLADLAGLRFKFDTQLESKRNLKNWLLTAPVDLTTLAATDRETLWDFLHSDTPLTWDIFYAIGLQLLDFVANFEFSLSDSLTFASDLHLPTVDLTQDTSSEHVISAIYLLMLSRRKNAMTLVEFWVSEGLLPLDNHYHFFNDKSLATFDTAQTLTREFVYVESPVDTERRGDYDLIKVEIIRPQFDGKLPVIMTASPYHLGTNDLANDQKLHDMAVPLTQKPLGFIEITDADDTVDSFPNYDKKPVPMAKNNQAQGHFTHGWTYSLNDYFLARGFASIYVASVGTRGSDGFMTSGDYQQIAGVTAVIDWLNGRARAFTSRKKTHELTADWATGHVVMTGKSYLGTLAYGAATTGVSGLDVIIAEAGITSWYDYYRENGLVRSPGGYPGEDLDVLAELTYSRNLDAADFLTGNATYQKQLADMTTQLDRASGDYNSYWHARNYLPNADKVTADVIIVHGMQDFNVTAQHAFKFWHALPQHVVKHAFLHQGSHVYINNWQSIDFSETINAYLTAKLLENPLSLDLPPVIWQENGAYQSFKTLDNFGATNISESPLGFEGEFASFDNHYDDQTFDGYSRDFRRFKTDLFAGKANAAVIDINVPEDSIINGQIVLNLRIKLNDTKGILSAQILDYGSKKRLNDAPGTLALKAIDLGRNFAYDDVKDLALTEMPYKVVTKGFMNLQNRQNLLEINSVTPDEWLKVEMRLEPTIYQLHENDTLRLLIYSTDFEHTVRDNRDVTYTLNLEKSRLYVPKESGESK